MFALLISLFIMAAAFAYTLTASTSLILSKNPVAASYAAAAFSYHYAAIAYKLTAPTFTGTIPLAPLETATNAATTFTACADTQSVMTRVIINVLPGFPTTTASALATVSATEPDIATVRADGTLQTIDDRIIATLPCAADPGETVLFTQVIK